MTSVTPLRVGFGLSGFVISASKDEVINFQVPAGVSKRTAKTIAIHVSGKTTTEHIAGNITGWPEFPRDNLPGETTSDFEWAVEAGAEFKATVLSDEYSYHCLYRKDNAVFNPLVVRKNTNDVFELTHGDQLYLAIGEVRVGERQFTAPCQLAAKSGNISVEVTQDCVGLTCEIL